MSEPLVIAPQEGSQEDFLNSDADFVIYGGAAGSGKSHTLLMDALQYVSDPKFYAVYFRANNTQLDGSLWPAAKKMYSPFGVKIKEKEKTITFPSGAMIKFAYLELEKHAIAHQGIEYSAEYFDEGTHYSWTQFDYLCSRLRSGAENSSFVKLTCNPDRDHWLYDWVEPYLLQEPILNPDGTEDEERAKGCPDRRLCGKKRYYHTVDSVVYSFWSLEELYETFPDRRCPKDPVKARKWVEPMSYTFIAG